MRGKKGVLHNLGVLTLAQFAAQVLNLVALVFLARYLGDRWFGVVQVGVAFSAYALIVAEWGLMSLGIREVARFDQPSEVLGYARSHQGLLALMAGGVLLLGFLVLPFFPFYKQDQALFLLYLALVIPQVWNQEWIGIGLERMPWVGAARTAASLIYALVVLVLIKKLDGLLGWPAWRWVPAVYLLSFFLGNLVIVFPVRHWLGGWVYPLIKPHGDWPRRIRETSPVGASIVTMRVLMNGDMILLGILALPEVAGRYAASAKIGFTMIIAMEVLWKALLPRLSRLANGSPEEFLSKFQLYFGLVAACLLPVAVGGWLLGADLMELIYGASYMGAGAIFQVLVVSYTFLALGWFLGNTLLAADRQKEFFPPLVISALLAIGGNLILVPRFGGIGAAMGMLLAHSVLFFILVYICRSWFGKSLASLVPAILLGLGAMAGVLLVLAKAWVVWKLAAGVAVYGLIAGWGLLRWTRHMMRPEGSQRP